jgi:hypothetical protein
VTDTNGPASEDLPAVAGALASRVAELEAVLAEVHSWYLLGMRHLTEDLTARYDRDRELRAEVEQALRLG